METRNRHLPDVKHLGPAMLDVVHLLPFSVTYGNTSQFLFKPLGVTFLSFAREIVLIQDTWGPTILIQELKEKKGGAKPYGDLLPYLMKSSQKCYNSCYGLSCVAPKSYVEALISYVDPPNVTIFAARSCEAVIRLNEVIGVEPESNMTGTLIRKETPGCPHTEEGRVREATAGRWLSRTKERGLGRNQICGLDLALPSFRTIRNTFLSFKPHTLWYFVMAALRD